MGAHREAAAASAEGEEVNSRNLPRDSRIRGHTYLTSAVGGGRGSKNSKNHVDIIYGCPLKYIASLWAHRCSKEASKARN